MEISGTELAIIAIIAAVGLIGVVATDIVIFEQDAEARSLCGESQGGFRNGSNSILRPP